MPGNGGIFWERVFLTFRCCPSGPCGAALLQTLGARVRAPPRLCLCPPTLHPAPAAGSHSALYWPHQAAPTGAPLGVRGEGGWSWERGGGGGLGTSKCLGVIKAVQPSWKWAVLSCVCAHGCAVVVCVCVQVRIQLSAVCRCVQAPCAVRVPTAGTPAWVSLGAEGAMGVPMLIKVPEPSMLGGHKRRLGAPPAQPPVPSLAPSLSSLMKPLSSLVAALIAEFVSSPVWGPRKGLTAAVPCATPTGYGQRAGAAYPGKGALVWDCTVGWEGLRGQKALGSPSPWPRGVSCWWLSHHHLFGDPWGCKGTGCRWWHSAGSAGRGQSCCDSAVISVG